MLLFIGWTTNIMRDRKYPFDVCATHCVPMWLNIFVSGYMIFVCEMNRLRAFTAHTFPPLSYTYYLLAPLARSRSHSPLPITCCCIIWCRSPFCVHSQTHAAHVYECMRTPLVKAHVHSHANTHTHTMPPSARDMHMHSIYTTRSTTWATRKTNYK